MTKTVTVRDRDIEVTPLNETQKMLIIREAEVMRSPRQGVDRKLRAIATVIDIVESVVKDEEDREYFMSLATTGDLELAEMFQIASDLDEETKPVKTVATVRRATRRR